MTWGIFYGFKLDGIFYFRRDAGHSIFAMPMMNDDYAVKCASILFQHFTMNDIKERLLAINDASEKKKPGYSEYADKNMTFYCSDKKGVINASMWYIGHESQTLLSSDPALHCNKLEWKRWGPGAQLTLDFLKANGEILCDKINLCELHHHMNMETFQDVFSECYILQPSLFEKQLSDNDVSCLLSNEFARKNPSVLQNYPTATIIDFDDMKLKCYKCVESIGDLGEDCGFTTLVNVKPTEYNLKVLMNRYYWT